MTVIQQWIQNIKYKHSTTIVLLYYEHEKEKWQAAYTEFGICLTNNNEHNEWHRRSEQATMEMN